MALTDPAAVGLTGDTPSPEHVAAPETGVVAAEILAEHPHVALVTMDRPPVNAITEGMYRQLTDIFSSMGDRPEVRCAVLTGAGDQAFTAGADVRQFLDLSPATGQRYMKIRRLAFEAVRDCPVPVIGSINGAALGAGIALAAACDVLVAAEDAQFGIPEILVGVLGGAKHLSRLLPEHTVRYLALTGKRVTAQQMKALGAVIDVVPQGQVLQTALDIADDIAAKGEYPVKLAKEALNLIENLELDEGYHVEQLHSIILSALPESKAAARAFLDSGTKRGA